MIQFSKTIYCINPAWSRVNILTSAHEGRIRYQYVSSSYTSSSSGLCYGSFIRRILEKVRSALSVTDCKRTISFPLLPSIRTSSTILEPYKSENYSITVSNVKATMYDRVYILKKTVAKPRNVIPFCTIDFKSSSDENLNVPIPCPEPTDVTGSDFGDIMGTLSKNDPFDNQNTNHSSWSDTLLKPINSTKNNNMEKLSIAFTNQCKPSIGKLSCINETNREFTSLKSSVNTADKHLIIKTVKSDCLKIDSEKKVKGNRNYCSFYLEDGIAKKDSIQKEATTIPNDRKSSEKMDNNVLLKGLEMEKSPYKRIMIMNSKKSKLRTIFYFENKSAYVIQASSFDNARPVQEYIQMLAKQKKFNKPARINFVEFHLAPHTENHLGSHESMQAVNFNSNRFFNSSIYRKETSISIENNNNKFWIPLKEEHISTTDKICIKESPICPDNFKPMLGIESKQTHKLVEDKLTEANDSSDPYITKIPIKKDKLIEETVVPNKSILSIINSIDKSGIIIQKDLYITDQIIQKIKGDKKQKDKAEVQTSGFFEDQNGEYILYFQVKSNDENGNVNVSSSDLTNKLTKGDFNDILTDEKTEGIPIQNYSINKEDHRNEVILLESCGSNKIILLRPEMDENKNITSFACLGNATFKGVSTIDIIKKSAALLEKEKYRQKRSSDSKEINTTETKTTINKTKPNKSPKDINSKVNNFHNNVVKSEISEKCLTNNIETQLDVPMKSDLINPKLCTIVLNTENLKLENKSNKNAKSDNNILLTTDIVKNSHECNQNTQVNLNPFSENNKFETRANMKETIMAIKDDTSRLNIIQNENSKIDKEDKAIAIPESDNNRNIPSAKEELKSKQQLQNNNGENKKHELLGLTISMPSLNQNKLFNYVECTTTNKSKLQIEKSQQVNQDKIIETIPPVECPKFIDDSVQFLMSKKGKDDVSLSNQDPKKVNSGGDRPLRKSNIDTGVQHISQTSITATKKNGKTDIKISEKETVIDSRLPIPFSTETLFQVFGSSAHLRGLANVIDSAKNELMASNMQKHSTTTKDIIQKLDEILREIKKAHITSLKSNKDENKNGKSSTGIISVDPKLQPSVATKEKTQTNAEPKDIKVISLSKARKKTKNKMLKTKKRNNNLKPGKNILTSEIRSNQSNSKETKFLKSTNTEGTIKLPTEVKNTTIIPNKKTSEVQESNPTIKKTESQIQTKSKSENNTSEQNNYVQVLKSVDRKNKILKLRRRRPGFFDHKSLSKRDKKILKEILKGSQKKRNSVFRRSKDSPSKLNKTKLIPNLSKQEETHESKTSGKSVLQPNEQNTANLGTIPDKQKNYIGKNKVANKATPEQTRPNHKIQNNPPKSHSNPLNKSTDALVDKNPKDIKEKGESRNTFMGSGFPLKSKTPRSPKKEEKQISSRNFSQEVSKGGPQKNKTPTKLKNNSRILTPPTNREILKKVETFPHKSKTGSPRKKTPNMVKNTPISPKHKVDSLKSKDVTSSTVKNNLSKQNTNIKDKHFKETIVDIDTKNTKLTQSEKSKTILKSKEIINNYNMPVKNKMLVNSENKKLEQKEENTQDKVDLKNSKLAQSEKSKNILKSKEINQNYNMPVKNKTSVSSENKKLEQNEENMQDKVDLKNSKLAQSDKSKNILKSKEISKNYNMPVQNKTSVSSENKKLEQNEENIQDNIDLKNSKLAQTDSKNILKSKEISKNYNNPDKNKASMRSENKKLETNEENTKHYTQENKISIANFNEKQHTIVSKKENDNKTLNQMAKTKIESIPRNINEEQNQSNKIPIITHSNNQNFISKSQVPKKSNESISNKASQKTANKKLKLNQFEHYKKNIYSEKTRPSTPNKNQSTSVNKKEETQKPIENSENKSPSFQIYVATKTSVDSKTQVKQSLPEDATNLMKKNNLQNQAQTERFKSRLNENNVNEEKKLNQNDETTVTVIERSEPKNTDPNTIKEKFKQKLIKSAKKKIEQQIPIHFRVKPIKVMPPEEDKKIKRDEKPPIKSIEQKGVIKSSEKENKSQVQSPKTLASSSSKKRTSMPANKSSGKLLTTSKSKKKNASQNRPTSKRNMKAIKVYAERSTKTPEETSKQKNIQVASIPQNVDTNKELVAESKGNTPQKQLLGSEQKGSVKTNEQLKKKTEVVNDAIKEELTAKTKSVERLDKISTKDNIKEKTNTVNKDDLANMHKNVEISTKSVELPIAKTTPSQPDEKPSVQAPSKTPEKEQTPFPMLLIDLDKMTKEIKPEFDVLNAHTCAVPLKQVENFPIMNSKKTENFGSPHSILNICPSKDPMLRKELSFFSSVTKILNLTLPKDSRNVLREWRRNMIKELGENGFKSYYKGQMTRGTQFHNLIQDYLVWGRGREKPTTQCFQSVYHLLSDLTDLAAINSHVVHKPLAYRGIVDCVAKYKKKPVVVEWKRLDNKEHLGESSLAASYLQLSAYIGALNFDENYKFQVRGGIIVIAYSDGNKADVHEVSNQDCEKFWKLWLDRLQSYHTYLQSKKK